MPTKPKTNPFSGNITIARGRFRRMSERALEKLQAKELNLLSFAAAAYLDVKDGHNYRTGQHTIEYKKSQERERRNARKMTA